MRKGLTQPMMRALNHKRLIKMKTIKEIRKDNLLKLLSKFDSKSQFAEKVGIKPSYLSHLLSDKEGSKEVGQLTARRFEESLDMEQGWMDKDNSIDQWNADVTPVIDAVFSLYDLLDELNVKPESLDRSMLKRLLAVVLKSYTGNDRPDQLELKAMLFDSIISNTAI